NCGTKRPQVGELHVGCTANLHYDLRLQHTKIHVGLHVTPRDAKVHHRPCKIGAFGKDFPEDGVCRHAAYTQLHPVVVPQSSHTMQCPLTFIRIELQFEHWSPV